MLLLQVGSGLFFLIYSRFVPFRYLGHAIAIVRGKHPDEGAKGHISHAGAYPVPRQVLVKLSILSMAPML
jgi:AGCS family alanine or glycine:cation symporter